MAMNEHITPTSEPCDLQESLAMQAGLALLDLLEAIAPAEEAERHKLRKRLEDSLQKAAPDHWYHRQLLQEMNEILR